MVVEDKCGCPPKWTDAHWSSLSRLDRLRLFTMDSSEGADERLDSP